jgi:pseudouridine synthase
VRLNAYLARAGVASRRRADELIKAGRVTVNGEPGRLNTFVGHGDRVEVDGKPVAAQKLTYVLLHKPPGTVTTARDPQGRPTVVELVDVPERIVPVGRLDADTTGALLLTNDGPLAHRLAHPRYGVEKVYEVEVEGEPSDEVLRRLAEGIELEDGRTAPARVGRLAPSRIELSIHEGRKHQVKRMCEAVGHPVRRLHRSRYADLSLEGLGRVARAGAGRGRPAPVAGSSYGDSVSAGQPVPVQLIRPFGAARTAGLIGVFAAM